MAIWAEIKKAINSNIDKSLDVLIGEKHDSIKSFIDGVNTNINTVNSRLTATRAGYLDKLNSGVPVSTLNGKIIKSIQRGVATISSNKKSELQTVTVTVNAVTVNKSILLISGQHYSSFVAASTADSPKTISAQLTNSTTITFSRWDVDSSFATVTIPYQLIEFY